MAEAPATALVRTAIPDCFRGFHRLTQCPRLDLDLERVMMLLWEVSSYHNWGEGLTSSFRLSMTAAWLLARQLYQPVSTDLISTKPDEQKGYLLLSFGCWKFLQPSSKLLCHHTHKLVLILRRMNMQDVLPGTAPSYACIVVMIPILYLSMAFNHTCSSCMPA